MSIPSNSIDCTTQTFIICGTSNSQLKSRTAVDRCNKRSPPAIHTVAPAPRDPQDSSVNVHCMDLNRNQFFS